MLHTELRAALQRKIEDLLWGGPTMAPVLECLAGHGDALLLETYDRLLLQSPGAPAALALRTRGASPDPERLARCAPRSLGQVLLLVRHARNGVAAHDSGACGHDADAAWLRHQLAAQRDLWRVVLGYGDTPFDNWALHAFTAAQTANVEGYLWIAVLFARVGFISPEATLAVHDCLADGWLRGKSTCNLLAVDWDARWDQPLEQVRADLQVESPPSTDAARRDAALMVLQTPGRLPMQLPEMFWDMVGSVVDPATITPRIAAFGITYDEALKDACARAILLHDGQVEVAAQPWPPRVDINSLSVHPPDTLGYEYYHLIVDNGFDPEVLNPDHVTGYHPGLDGTNRRILQTHEVWHLVAGYSTSPLHETAISSFQLAQFGHNYSAIFLATTFMLLLFSVPIFADPIMQVMAEGWRHGRRTRPLMLIDWWSLWSRSIGDIRVEYGITPFESVIPDALASSSGAFAGRSNPRDANPHQLE